MPGVKYVREEDQVTGEALPQGAGEIDISPLLGTWENTNNETRGIIKVIVGQRDGELTVRVFGACSPEPCAWGATNAEVIYAKSVQSREVMAFSAVYDFGYLRVNLQANLSLGLLVIAGLNTFNDGSGRSNYFSREFFYRASGAGDASDSHQARPADARSFVRDEENAAPQAARPGGIDKAPFLGRWRTTNSASRGIVGVDVVADGPGLAIQTFGSCSPTPCDWGQAKAALFSEGPASNKGLAFSAGYDFEFLEIDLQAKIKKGVLVVAVFNKFKDESGRSNYFSREFFYRP